MSPLLCGDSICGKGNFTEKQARVANVLSAKDLQKLDGKKLKLLPAKDFWDSMQKEWKNNVYGTFAKRDSVKKKNILTIDDFVSISVSMFLRRNTQYFFLQKKNWAEKHFARKSPLPTVKFWWWCLKLFFYHPLATKIFSIKKWRYQHFFSWDP